MLNLSAVPFKYKTILKNVFKKTEEYFAVKGVFGVDVCFLNEAEMLELNKRTRGVDKATDVLSYPSMEIGAKFPIDKSLFTDDLFDGKTYTLGSVAICESVALKQAEEYGHSVKREAAFLFSHALLHLLGFDHLNEEQEKEMRFHQEKILSELGYVRK